MKKFATALCTLTLLVSFSACGVEKPDIDSVTEKAKSTDGSSATESKKVTLSRKDSHIKGDLGKRFHVDAEILNEKKSLPTYYLSKINLTEDQLAETLMTNAEFTRSDSDEGLITYSNDKERLVLDLNGKYSDSSSPNLTYALDKGKEYESVIRPYMPYESIDTEASRLAVGKVTEILDKLPVKYDSYFQVEKASYEFLNASYPSGSESDKHDEIPEEFIELYGLPEEIYTQNLMLLSEGKDAKLDKDFKFSKNDGVFVVAGNMMVGDMVIAGSGYKPYSIIAAVSSRGVEYLYVEDLYISDNGSSDSPLITPEQGSEAIHKDYESAPNNDKYEVYIDKAILKYVKDTGSSDKEKIKLRPVWRFDMSLTMLEQGYATTGNCEVYADTGELVNSFFPDFISYDYPNTTSDSGNGE